MAGGSVEGWIQGRSLLETMAARYEGEPCCAYLGSGGAGHFVKMVHNGIEYAMLQLYADGWQLLRRSSMPHDPIASVFDAWRVGPLAGYLTDAAAAVMRKQDERTGRPLVEVIRSAAGQKGTGRWTVEEAIRLGVYAPTICEAVFARALSQQENLRAAGSRALAAGLEAHCDAEALERAMLAGMLCCYAQGFDLIRQGCAQYGWEAQLRTVARIWRNGCIIRSSLLNDIEQVLGKEPDVPNLLLTKRFASVMAELQRPWRSVAAMAAMSGIAAPALVSTLIYYDSIRTADMPISLVQGMRDYFGAHGCERNDCCGIFHTDWEE
jgi:6-phosphogluconate dehydrogenase